ncbi:MAG: polysaccharide deacetylase family protein [Chloroflexota bacterium]|nr:polysaccharide deacetylase family protein [Chloroflexota bacterium]
MTAHPRCISTLVLLFATMLALVGCDNGVPTAAPVTGTATVQPTSAPLALPTLSATSVAQHTAPTNTLEPLFTVTPEPASPSLELPSATTEATGTEQRSRSTVRPVPTHTFIFSTVTPRPRRATSTPDPFKTSITGDETSTAGPILAPESTPTATSTLLPIEGSPLDGWGEVVRAAPGKHRIALTFDAGASGDAMPDILAALHSHGVHITMFITGKFAEQYPDSVKAAAAAGNEIANHTYSHLDSRKLSDAQLEEELSHTETIISGLTGISTKPFWRPPFGARNNHVLNVAVSQGYRSIYWTLDSLDSVGQPKTPDFIFNRVTNTHSVNLDGAIVLQHIGSAASAAALPLELDRLQAMGLQVVTISELLSP